VLDLVLALPAERFANLYGALPPDLSAALDGPIARMLNSRVPSVRRQPQALRARALRAWIVRQRDEDVAGDLLRVYFLGPRLPLVTSFLDATGVKHEKGQIGDDAEPDPAKVPAAVEALQKEFEADDVRLYLAVAARQWPENKAVLEAAAAADRAAGEASTGSKAGR
jgi:hypothetical protein